MYAVQTSSTPIGLFKKHLHLANYLHIHMIMQNMTYGPTCSEILSICIMIYKTVVYFFTRSHRTSLMSGSLARIPIHRCLDRLQVYLSEPSLGTVWCDCPDTELNYIPHRLCFKSNLYKMLDNYLFYHPSLVKSASYI